MSSVIYLVTTLFSRCLPDRENHHLRSKAGSYQANPKKDLCVLPLVVRGWTCQRVGHYDFVPTFVT